MSASEDSTGNSPSRESDLGHYAQTDINPISFSDGEQPILAAEDDLLASSDLSGGVGIPRTFDTSDQVPFTTYQPGEEGILEPTTLKPPAPFINDRPNKYYGLAATWSYWTKEERQIAKSLEELRNKDLSAHLYNVHALKVRKRKAEIAAASGAAVDASATFVPNKGWTAWPMPPTEVARATLSTVYDREEQSTYVSPGATSSSIELRECLLAFTLRLARTKYESRAWEEGVEPDVSIKPNPNSSPPKKPLTQTETTSLPTFSSQAFRDEESSEEDDSSEGSELIANSRKARRHNIDGYAAPQILADDVVAEEILRPSIGQAASNLDDLLSGLHRARQSYAVENGEETLFIEDLMSSRRRKSRSRSRRRQSREDRIPAAARPQSEASNSGSQPPKRGRPRKAGSQTTNAHRTTQLKPRDWSDVLAMAAMTGFSGPVLERAAKRCANLFEEDMHFRTFHEADSDDPEPSCFMETTATGREVRIDDADIPQTLPSEAVSSESGPDIDDTAGESTGAAKEFSCGHERCRRRGLVYASAIQLKRHMRDHHHISRNPLRREASSDASMAGLTTEAEVEKNFFCPVAACSRHTKSLSTAHIMYEHVKRVHPEIDIDGFKSFERERRGERRGKHSRDRRHRSTSASSL